MCTVNQFGKGPLPFGSAHYWELPVGMSDTPYERYEAVAELIRPFLKPQIWRLKAPDNSIICRRLTDGNDDLFVLIQ